MDVRVNGAMLELLGRYPEFFEPSTTEIPAALERLATAGFKEEDGCVSQEAGRPVVAHRQLGSLQGGSDRLARFWSLKAAGFNRVGGGAEVGRAALRGR